MNKGFGKDKVDAAVFFFESSEQSQLLQEVQAFDTTHSGVDDCFFGSVALFSSSRTSASSLKLALRPLQLQFGSVFSLQPGMFPNSI